MAEPWSPLLPVVARIFMANLEQKALDQFKTRSLFWCCFIDDVFLLVKRAVVKELLDHLNRRHNCIKFTVEEEYQGKLPFLDVCAN